MKFVKTVFLTIAFASVGLPAFADEIPYPCEDDPLFPPHCDPVPDEGGYPGDPVPDDEGDDSHPGDPVPGDEYPDPSYPEDPSTGDYPW